MSGQVQQSQPLTVELPLEQWRLVLQLLGGMAGALIGEIDRQCNAQIPKQQPGEARLNPARGNGKAETAQIPLPEA